LERDASILRKRRQIRKREIDPMVSLAAPAKKLADVSVARPEAVEL